MKPFVNDPSLDRVLLISREEMGGAAGGFDPLHPVYTQTEGTDPFTYRNDFCHMRLLADGTVELTEQGSPARFAEEWQRLFSQLAACRTLCDLRIYDFDGEKPPMAAALTTYGRLLLYGNVGAEFAPAAGWQGVTRIFWDTDGFGALCEDDMFRAVGALSVLDGIAEVEEAVGSELPGHCRPVAYLLQKNGTVTLYDRKNKSIQRPRERVQKIALVRYNPYGVSTWVAISKITGRFLCSEPRDAISADFFGGDYTDIIAPNRFRQKIADFAAVPRRYLAVLYQNGYLRVFGSGYHSGDILCEDVRGIELEGEELIAYLPADLSYAPAIDGEEPQDDSLSPAESVISLGAPVRLPEILSLLRERVEHWRQAERLMSPAAKKPVRAIRRSSCYIYFLYQDGTVEAELLTHTGHSDHGENAVSHWRNVVELIPGRHHTLALCADGTVLAAGQGYGQPYAVSGWRNVTQIAQSSGLAAAVTASGTVYALWADSNEPVQGTESWQNITTLAAGDDFLLGLTADGRVVAAGLNESILSAVKDWRNIIQIAAVSEAVAALTGEGRVLSCGNPRFLRYEGMECWRNIRQLVSYQNGGSVFVGLDGAGRAHFCGKWSGGALCRTDSIDPEKWSGLRRVWQEGYYLLGEKADGTIVYESTPTERAGLPPADDHITDWSLVTAWVIEGEYLMAIFRDGTVGWEGTRRRTAKRRITSGWKKIRYGLLWSIEGGRSSAMAVDAEGHLFSDQSDPAAAEFFGQFSGVRHIAVFQPFLLVLHGETLSFVLFGKNGWERHDLPQVESLLTAEEGKTVVVTFTDGRVRSFGQTLYDSTVDPAAKNVRFYGDRSDYIENDADPFCHFEGVIGLQGAGQAFVLSAANLKSSEHFYSVQQLMYFSGIRGAVTVEPLGDLLLADGTCRSRRGDFFAKWVGIMQLSSCPTHSVGVTTFHTAVVYGDGEYGSCSVDSYMNIVQAFALPHATVLRQSDGTLISLCEKLSETPYEPLPVTSGVTQMAMTGSHFAILCADGSLWCCEAQAFADKIRWRGSSEYYTRPWGMWQKRFTDATRMTVTGEEIRIWRHDTRYSFMEPTLEQNTLSGQEPTIL